MLHADKLNSVQPLLSFFSSKLELVETSVAERCWSKMWNALNTSNDRDVKVGLELMAARDIKLKKGGKKEDFIQALMAQVHSVCCKELKSPLVPRDTHLIHAPTQPHHKMDFTFVSQGCASASENERVSWMDVVTCDEYKSDFETEHYNEVRIQVVDNAMEIFRKQPDRKFAYAIIGCGRKLEMFRVENEPALPVRRSGCLDFLLQSDTPTDGFRLYCQLLSSSAETIGFTPFSVLCPAAVSDAMQWENPRVSLQRRGPEGKPHVFSVNVGPSSFCVKIHQNKQAFHNELQIYGLKCGGVIKLVKAIESVLALVVEPWATASLEDDLYTDSIFASACTSAAAALDGLHTNGFAYIDPSPSNVLVAEESGGSNQCYWNDFSHVAKLGTLTHFAGTVAYSSLAMCSLFEDPLKTHAYCRLDDMEAVFFTLLSYAFVSNGRKRVLPWITNEISLTKKFIAMRKPDEHIFNHVQPFAESLLRDLHKLVFVEENYKGALELLKSVAMPAVAPAIQVINTNVADTVFGARKFYHVSAESHGGYGYTEMAAAVAKNQLKPCEKCFPSSASGSTPSK